VAESPDVVTLSSTTNGYMCFLGGEKNFDYLELRFNLEVQGERQMYLKYFLYLRI
jgi:hypothetical protein